MPRLTRTFLIRVATVLALLMPQIATAQEATRGQETNLPLPRFVSLKASEANVRRGPSLSHRIDWVFQRRDMPLQIIAEFGHWRRVQDADGAAGWIHYSLLSGVRTALVTVEALDLRSDPTPDAVVNARAEKGVVLRLLECEPAWCLASADGYKGWVPKDGMWGVEASETFE